MRAILALSLAVFLASAGWSADALADAPQLPVQAQGHPEKGKAKPDKKPKQSEAAPDYMADLIAIHDRIHGELTNKADALALYAAKNKAEEGFWLHANLDPVDSQEREARNLNLELAKSKKARDAGDRTGFGVDMSLYAKYKAAWASYFYKTTLITGNW